VFTADELNRTDLHQVDPVIRRVIGHARQRREVDWLLGCSARTAVRELMFSSSAVTRLNPTPVPNRGRGGANVWTRKLPTQSALATRATDDGDGH